MEAKTTLEDQSAVFYEIVYLPDNQTCVDCSKHYISPLKLLQITLRKV